MVHIAILCEGNRLNFERHINFFFFKDVSLAPDKWPQEEFDKLKNYTAQTSHTPKPLAVSRGHGVVSGTSSSLAVHAGLVALRQGGNAMDACISTALTGNILKFI